MNKKRYQINKVIIQMKWTGKLLISYLFFISLINLRFFCLKDYPLMIYSALVCVVVYAVLCMLCCVSCWGCVL